MYGSIAGNDIHGDPHPGNIRFLPDNKVGLLDFGIIARPSKHPERFFGFLQAVTKAELVKSDNPGEVFIAYIRFLANDLYRAIEKLSNLNPSGRSFSQKLSSLVDEIVEREGDASKINRSKDEVNYGSTINKIVNGDNNRFGLITKIEDIEILRSSQTFVTLVTSLGLRSIVPGMNKRIIDAVSECLPEVANYQEKEMDRLTAFEVISSWFERVADRDMSIFNKLSVALKPELESIDPELSQTVS